MDFTMDIMLLTCIQCGDSFEYSASDQRYYTDRGFDVPRRCVSCRKNKSKALTGSLDRKERNRKRDYRLKYDI